MAIPLFTLSPPWTFPLNWKPRLLGCPLSSWFSPSLSNSNPLSSWFSPSLGPKSHLSTIFAHNQGSCLGRGSLSHESISIAPSVIRPSPWIQKRKEKSEWKRRFQVKEKKKKKLEREREREIGGRKEEKNSESKRDRELENEWLWEFEKKLVKESGKEERISRVLSIQASFNW